MQRFVRNSVMEKATAQMNFSAAFLRTLIKITQYQGYTNTHNLGGRTHLSEWLHQVGVPIDRQSVVARAIQQQLDLEFGTMPNSLQTQGVATIFELTLPVEKCSHEYFRALPEYRQTLYKVKR